MQKGDCIVPITDIFGLSAEKCKGCSDKTTHCILKQGDKIPCCTKQICIFELLRNAKSQKEKG